MASNRTSLLPESLRSLVSDSVALLGQVIRSEAGDETYSRIESIRRKMTAVRGASSDSAHRTLMRVFDELARQSPGERVMIAEAFTLMLELMNACENSYRVFRLAHRPKVASPRSGLEAIVYVFTAHPTESRSAANSALFREVQAVLVEALTNGFASAAGHLEHLLRVLWRVQIAPEARPTIGDEASYLYSIALREEILVLLTDADPKEAPIYFRSWVGGDKDGHPGVDKNAFALSLSISRAKLLEFVRHRLSKVDSTLALLPEDSVTQVNLLARALRKDLSRMEKLGTGDGRRAVELRRDVRKISQAYLAAVGSEHPELSRIDRTLKLFPALVVPLEFRESSDVLTSKKDGQGLAISGMLKRLGQFSKGGDPRWYVRGFVISMASQIEHVRQVAHLMRLHLGDVRVPIVPLFEQEDALRNSPIVIREMLADARIRSAISKFWGGHIEVMVGYSDSAKEMGVLPSRVAIADGLTRLERTMKGSGVQLIFFHGSGGSVDRGGGSVQEQMSWWPKSSLKLFKATIQGEMVDRSLASSEIARQQWDRIEEASARLLKSPPQSSRSREVRDFTARVEKQYRSQVASPAFLSLIEIATPYPYLSLLRIGSRPSKRAGGPPTVSSLRAIPWVLCWTQVRLLFPTWWGIGSAWKATSASARKKMAHEFHRDSLFSTYVQALGFTLAKVELPVWRVYLERSGLPAEQVKLILTLFEKELEGARSFVRDLAGSRDLLWFRPWLGQSIRLRSPMIHPLNLLQKIAIEKGEDRLLRVTVTGIASGMLTTG